MKWVLLAASAIAGLSSASHAAPTGEHPFHLPAQDLGPALRAVGRASGIDVMFPADAVEGLRAPALDGSYDPQQAIKRLLAGSGLSAKFTEGGVLIGGRSQPSGRDRAQSVAPDEIVVTGTHIKGRTIAAPTVVKTQAALVDQGFASVADAVRSLPQNFSGGQNPGVGVGAGGSPENENVSSGSTINLRGIGQDATLTLLNGHRIAYDVASQGVDVSIMPLAALDRIEVVTDGASALYGSDAVAGVANIILKRDYEGASLSARLGTSTGGGDFQQEYSVVTGHRWDGGGFIATYDYERDTAIEAGQRDYTGDAYPGQTLLPYERRHAVVASAHQALSPDLTFSIDGSFNERWSNLNVPLTGTADYRSYGVDQTSRTIAFSVAPSLSWSIGSDWTLSATGVYGRDRSHYSANVYYGGQVISPSAGCYCNSFTSAEAGVEGPVAHLGGGDIRIAAGGGVRRNALDAYRTAGDPLAVDVHQSTDFAYGEVSAPLVSPDQAIPLVHRLSLSGAVRWERYPGIASVTTPRFSVIYAPAPWLDLLGNWGRSFKAPTLYQRYATTYSTLYPASTAGGVGYPTGATVVELTGANPDLRPERATNWTVGMALHPVPELSIRIDSFHIEYHNRVVQPITNLSAALATDAYAGLVDEEPSAADAAAAIDPTRYDFENLAGATAGAASVAAIIDNRYQNVARQKIRGVDASLTWHRGTQALGAFDVEAAASRLDSDQTLLPGAASLPLAGVIFNPPHWRGRGGVTWHLGGLSVAAYGNYIGPLRDDRSAPIVRVGSMTTADLTIHYHIPPGDRLLAGIDIVLSVQNLFDAAPARIRTTAAYLLPYDSTNYSAAGRFVGLTITKSVR
jgi:outer membrane receptor protein involved in Fe transport